MAAAAFPEGDAAGTRKADKSSAVRFGRTAELFLSGFSLSGYSFIFSKSRLSLFSAEASLSLAVRVHSSF